MVNLNIAYPPTPTRFGYNSANTIDIAIIKNFYYPFTINSIDDLSSDHNPVFLNFNFKLAIEPPNPRAVSTDWNAFRLNLNNNLSLFDYHPNSINNTCELENKISEFTEAVIDTHSHASRPIGTDRRNFTPQHINRLLKLKNYLRKQYHQTLNPIFKLKNFINEHNLLNPNQYGFTNKLSTLHPLLRLTEHISEGFQKRKSTGAVFLDIQKAFDRVWINGLTFKLISYNLPPPLIHLIHSYLTNRSFKIRINETLSNEHSVSAGCPQGSLLGPLLFNLYVNDIPDYTLTKINLYADDTAIHATYKNLSTITFAINKHLHHLQNFYDKWKISINVEKSTAIIFTKTLTATTNHDVQQTDPLVSGSKIPRYNFRYTPHMEKHIQYTRDKFRKIMFKLYPLIGRNSHLSRENKVLLYTAVMRPIIAYASPVWGYAAKTNINILDTLQNSLIRMIVKATRYMRNDDIRKALKITSFKTHIQNLAVNFF
ncbi:RNA-directed DNA polymerase from mobile element jockey [Trichonephila clavipes]|nr:RNA-directed DNA polymerase from mobile element jockey [Trichonephila clavipes]